MGRRLVSSVALAGLLAGVAVGSASAATLRVDAWQRLALAGTADRAALAGTFALAAVAGPGGSGAVFASANGGAAWRPSTIGIGFRRIAALAVDPTAAGRGYAATASGLYRTRDGGVTWARVTGYAPVAEALAGVAVDPLRGTVLVVPTATTGDERLLSAPAGGVGWRAVAVGLPGGVRPLGATFDPATGDAYAWSASAVFVLRLHAASWDAMATAGLSTPVARVAPDGRGLLFATDGDGAVARHDADVPNGAWVATSGYPGSLASGFAADGSGALWLVDATGHVRFLPHGGSTWSVRDGDIGAARAVALAVDPVDDGHILATLGGDVASSTTTNAGIHWVPTAGGLSGAAAASVAAVGTRGALVVVRRRVYRVPSPLVTPVAVPVTRVDRIAGAPTGVALAAGDVLARSLDGGKTWTTLAPHGFPGAPDELAVDAVDPAVAVVVANGAVRRSVDGGATWTPVAGAAGVVRVAAAADGGFWLAGDGGLALLTAAGTLVDRTPVVGLGTTAVAAEPTDPALLLVVVPEGGLFRSADAGVSWAPAGAGIPGDIDDIALGAGAFALTPDGPFRSSDGGWTFRPITGGDPIPLAQRIVVDANGTAYATTQVAGLVAYTPHMAPTIDAPPVIKGTARLRTVVVGTRGVVRAQPAATRAFAWLRCDARGMRCLAIANAIGQRYRTTTLDRGHRLRLRLTATNRYGSVVAQSLPTLVVR